MANALARETSPYLLQHANNPVDWQPWGEKALQQSRDQNKPILLSIGYSACHWCHVMAHESFEDQATAGLMNRLYINIKVDREERPDLDKIYQRAHQMLTQRSGGWPLTLFLMPEDQIPFFAGTYFPRQAHSNLPGFSDVLQRVSDYYHQQHDELQKQNHSLMEAFASMQAAAPSDTLHLTAAPLDIARKQLENSMDWKHGGFGQAPKFPHPTNIERLLRHWFATQEQDRRALDMVNLSLQKMSLGGLQDQLGGGFCRYSVDDLWMIPHFEKMLYDNGPLLALYSDALAATGDPLYRQTAQAIANWVIQDMQSPEGGYYSSVDADSEGEEGKFYSWQQSELHQLLNEQEYQVAAIRYGFDREANFEDNWYPHTFTDWQTLCDKTGLDNENARTVLDQARTKLLVARKTRIHPHRDDKILTSWNALMIRGMAIAARRLQQPAWVDSAFLALDFIRTTLWQNNRLLATYKDGRAHLDAYLDDYVFLIDAILELTQTRWRDGDLDFALQLADQVLERFIDNERGGFYFTASDHEQLIDRSKPMADESTPAGNGVAALVFGRLGHLTGDTRYLRAAENTLKASWSSIMNLPYAHAMLLNALQEYLSPPQIIILRGKGDVVKQWQQACQQDYAPQRLVFSIPNEAENLPPMLAERKSAGDVIAYICEGTRCLPAIDTLEALQQHLNPH